MKCSAQVLTLTLGLTAACGGAPEADSPYDEMPEPGTVAFTCDAKKLVDATDRRCERIEVKGVAATGLASMAGRKAAADMDLCTVWNAELEAPQSVAFDLGSAQAIDGVIVVPDMNPEGQAEIVIEGSDDGKTYTELDQLKRSWVSGTEYEIELNRSSYQFVRLTTKESVSWPAWREVILLHCNDS